LILDIIDANGLKLLEWQLSSAHPYSLSGRSQIELDEFVVSRGLPKYRAKQLHSWIYAKWANSFEQMTDISSELRAKLIQECKIAELDLAHLQVSRDGTRKYLFSLADKQLVESVLMSFDDRSSLSACVSSQVGCAVGCTFCATGYLGFKRNLTAQEIVDQIMSIQRESRVRVSNVVFMGQGEPLLNVKEVVKSIGILNKSVGIGARHITVSTSGIIPGIEELAKAKLPVILALSLHSADPQRRAEIVPITKKYPLKELMSAMRHYVDQVGRRVTIEYVLLNGVNDQERDARQIASLVKGLPCYINLIPYNPTVNEDGVSLYERPPIKHQKHFKRMLEELSGKTVTLRLERGTDIDAACGQLHNKYIEAAK
jgi:23S rRNA (adenine2503-C2)-methyltransferase